MTFVPAWKRLGLQLKNAPVGENIRTTPPNGILPLKGDSGIGKRKLSSGAASADSKTSSQPTKRQRISDPASSPQLAKVTFNDGQPAAVDLPNGKGEDISASKPSTSQGKAPIAKPKSILKKSTPATALEPVKAKKAKPSKKAAPNTEKHAKIEAYLDYLTRFLADCPSWKFNKTQQTHVLKNAFNVNRITPDYNDALIAYIEGLRGDAARERLREDAQKIFDEPSEEVEEADEEGDTKASDETSTRDGIPEDGGTKENEEEMDRPEVRKQAKREAAKADERRLKDMLKSSHQVRKDRAYSNKFPSKLARRQRAETILEGLRRMDARRGNLAQRDSVVNGFVERASRATGQLSAGQTPLTVAGKMDSNPPEKEQRRERGTRGRKKRTLRTGLPDDDDEESSSSSSSSSEEEDSQSDDSGEADSSSEGSVSSDDQTSTPVQKR